MKSVIPPVNECDEIWMATDEETGDVLFPSGRRTGENGQQQVIITVKPDADELQTLINGGCIKLTFEHDMPEEGFDIGVCDEFKAN